MTSYALTYKLIIMLLLSLSPLSSLWAQQIVVNRLGDWVPDSVTLTGSMQGLAIHNNKAFAFRHGGQCVVLDLQHHRYLHTFCTNTGHSNNVSFGPCVDTTTPFPLLYVSECFGDKACYVYRLIDTNDSIDAQLCYRIVYDGSEFPIAQDWCIDAEAGFLYAYGGRRGQTLYLKKFLLPPTPNAASTTNIVTDTVPTLHLTPTDVLETIPIKGIKVAQGSKVYHNIAFLPDGDTAGNYWLHLYDLHTQQEINRIDLNPYNMEPEGIDIQGSWLYVSLHSPDPRNNRIIRYRLRHLLPRQR